MKNVFLKRFLLLAASVLYCGIGKANEIWDNDLRSTWFSSGNAGMSKNTTPEPSVKVAPMEDLLWIPALMAGCYLIFILVRSYRRAH